MKKIIVAVSLALALFATSASAEWQLRNQYGMQNDYQVQQGPTYEQRGSRLIPYGEDAYDREIVTIRSW